jgi:hypothetical protein
MRTDVSMINLDDPNLAVVGMSPTTGETQQSDKPKRVRREIPTFPAMCTACGSTQHVTVTGAWPIDRPIHERTYTWMCCVLRKCFTCGERERFVGVCREAVLAYLHDCATVDDRVWTREQERLETELDDVLDRIRPLCTRMLQDHDLDAEPGVAVSWFLDDDTFEFKIYGSLTARPKLIKMARYAADQIEARSAKKWFPHPSRDGSRPQVGVMWLESKMS